MNTIFTEDITTIKTVNNPGMPDVVHTVKYILACRYKDRDQINMFEVTLPKPSPDGFLNYESLKKEQVLEWVRSEIGADSLAKRKSAMIDMIDQTLAAEQAVGKTTPQFKEIPWM